MEGKNVIMPKELTAENGAKYLMMGEFFVEIDVDNPNHCGCEDENCDRCMDGNEPETLNHRVYLDWTIIKEIYAKAVKHLAK